MDPTEYFEDPDVALGPDSENVIVLANPVKPHSRGEIVLARADPEAAPEIRMNYFSDPHDLDVMVAIVRKVLEVVDNWPGNGLGPLYVPPALAKAHGYKPGDRLSDELIKDMARHYSTTVYHLTSTCRIGDVVDPQLRVNGVAGLRVADASVMPDVISGNTNAPVIMIGEKAAEMIAADHGVSLREHVAAS
jgi:choline dehydrogenase-like flavoprotein